MHLTLANVATMELQNSKMFAHISSMLLVPFANETDYMIIGFV